MTVPQHVPYVFVYVNNLRAARNYYENFLGLRVLEEDPMAVKYDTGQTMLAVNVNAQQPIGLDPRITIAFKIHELDPLREFFVAKGVKQETLDDNSLSFEDPWGHRFLVSSGGASEELGTAAITGITLHTPEPAKLIDTLGQLEFIAVDDKASLQLSFPSVDILAAPPIDTDESVVHEVAKSSTVFEVEDMGSAHASLLELDFRVGTVNQLEIGKTLAFADQDGHSYYLYEASDIALELPSGVNLWKKVA